MAGQSSYSRLAGDDEAAIISGSEDYDTKKLRLLGYKPQLKRNLTLLSNFSVTFSIVSVLTGITALYGTGLEFGGPVTMVYGWPIAGTFTVIVGLAMAEICSAYPTSGGLYFWSAKLCSERRWGPFASWLTGCHIPVHGYSTFMVASSTSGTSRPLYEGVYTIGGYGEGYFFPTWVAA